MKTCPQIVTKQCVYSKIHFGHLVEIPVKTWNFILGVQMLVYGVEILYGHFCVQNTQNVYK